MAVKDDKKEQEVTPLTEGNVASKIDMDPREVNATKKPMFMCRVVGQCNMIKSKEGKNGDVYSYIVGDVYIINGKGQHFTCGKMYLPAGLLEEVESAYKAGGEQPTKFGYDVYANYDKGVSVGYRYAAKKLFESEATNVLRDMLKDVMGSKPLPPIQQSAT